MILRGVVDADAGGPVQDELFPADVEGGRREVVPLGDGIRRRGTCSAGQGDVGYDGMRWITVGPADQPGTSIVLHPAAVDPGVTDDERRTMVEMMAKGTYAVILLATADLDGTFERVQASGAEVVAEPTEQPYGVRDCAVAGAAVLRLGRRGAADGHADGHPDRQEPGRHPGRSAGAQRLHGPKRRRPDVLCEAGQIEPGDADGDREGGSA